MLHLITLHCGVARTSEQYYFFLSIYYYCDPNGCVRCISSVQVCFRIIIIRSVLLLLITLIYVILVEWIFFSLLLRFIYIFLAIFSFSVLAHNLLFLSLLLIIFRFLRFFSFVILLLHEYLLRQKEESNSSTPTDIVFYP